MSFAEDQLAAMRNREAQEAGRQERLDYQAAQLRNLARQEVQQGRSFYDDLNAGRYSAALAQQRGGLGQNTAAMQSASVGNPLAARGAMFQGGQQATQAIGQYAGQRQQEVLGAQQQAFAAYLRQQQYEDELRKMQQEYLRNLQAAHQDIATTAMGERRTNIAGTAAMVQGGIGAASAGMGAIGKMGGW